MNLEGVRRAMVHAVEKEKEKLVVWARHNGQPAFMCSISNDSLRKILAEAIRRDLDLLPTPPSDSLCQM
jgi:hypothetical protein